MNNNKVKKQIASDLAKEIKPMISGFLEYLDSMGFELDENGDIVPKKSKNFNLFLKKRDKNE